jgi:hypothetical protein
MELNIRAGMRVLYKKNNSNWLVGEIGGGNAALDENGLYLPIWTMTDKSDCTLVNINDIFFDAHIVDDTWKDYNILLTKNEYIKIIEEEENFIKSIERAYVSDGEYYYYPITKFNRTWLEKQPFDYVVRF